MDNTILNKLLEDRIIIVSNEITTDLANDVISKMLYLYSLDRKKDITLYINSVGGSVNAGLAIYDTINHLECDVATVGMGTCASMGAFLLSSGTKGKRSALTNCEILIHQPLISGKVGLQGQTTDILIHAQNLDKLKHKLSKYLADNTGQDYQDILEYTERDYYMNSYEAQTFGLIDKVLK